MVGRNSAKIESRVRFPHLLFRCLDMKEFVFYFPKLHRTRSIIAHDEATAVWKLFYQFKLRERDVDGYKIVAQGKISVKNLLRLYPLISAG